MFIVRVCNNSQAPHIHLHRTQIHSNNKKTPHPNATHSSRQPSAGVVCMHSLSFRYQLHFANNCSNLIYRNQFDWLVPMNTQHGAMRIYNDRQSQSIRISKGAAQNQNQAAHNWRALKQVVRSVVKRHCQFICPFCGSPKRFYIAHIGTHTPHTIVPKRCVAEMPEKTEKLCRKQ